MYINFKLIIGKTGSSKSIKLLIFYPTPLQLPPMFPLLEIIIGLHTCDIDSICFLSFEPKSNYLLPN
jgi:hypothetical protein